MQNFINVGPLHHIDAIGIGSGIKNLISIEITWPSSAFISFYYSKFLQHRTITSYRCHRNNRSESNFLYGKDSLFQDIFIKLSLNILTICKTLGQMSRRVIKSSYFLDFLLQIRFIKRTLNIINIINLLFNLFVYFCYKPFCPFKRAFTVI